MAYRTPKELADQMAGKRSRDRLQSGDCYVRETFTLPREEARAKARDWLNAYPAAAYMSEVEWWRELPGDRIEFRMRRLRSAD